MPAGTWNLGRLRKKVDYVGLKDMSSVVIRDASPFSDQFFNITKFPDTLTGGKNLFKLKANSNNLVRNSQIHIEVLDSNGNPIYYEPINYVESDGTRVTAIWIYPDTPTGTATVYVAGRARRNPRNNQSLRFSQNVNDRDYFHIPNILWSRTVPVAPSQYNTTEIIFTRQPELQAREVVQPYLQPINLTNVAQQKPGGGIEFTVNPIPGSTVSTTLSVENEFVIGASNLDGNKAVGGSLSLNTPDQAFGFTLLPEALAVALADDGDLTAVPGKSSQTMTTTQVLTVLNESRMETTAPFFSSSMQNGIVKIRNPFIDIGQIGAEVVGGFVRPKSQEDDGGTPDLIGATGVYQLSGSYDFVVDTIFNTKKADVVLLGGFKNITDNATGGKWSVTLNATPGKSSQTIDAIEATTNVTASFTEPFVTQMTEQSQSFAEIKLANIEPATGDVYKVKTLYKPGGMFGDFIDAGDTVLEQLEVLEDTGSFESNAQDATGYNRIGFFTGLGDFETYFTSSGGDIAPEVAITPTFEPDDMMSGVRFSPGGSFNTTTNRFGYIKVKDEYNPFLVKHSSYLLNFNAFADDSGLSTDPNISKPRLDIYMSGSQGNIQADGTTVNSYVLTDGVSFNQTIDDAPFTDGSSFGTRIGTLEFAPSASLLPATFKITMGPKSETAKLYFVVRRGRWNVANVSLKTFNESKFTPNFTRINTRIPTEFLNTPMTFKFQFFDIAGNKADTEAFIHPIEFTGDNTLIAGNNNLITGSVYVGSAVGDGIEIAGVNSGFIRSIGYEGFLSASRTDRPGGFLMYTGSILPNTPDNYQGVGIELVEHSSSFLRFATDTVSGRASGLEVQTPRFFLGSEAQFISGANGKIEISSSNFHLDNAGDVIMQGTITAEAGGTIGGWLIGATELSSSGNELKLDSNGPYYISSSNFQLDAVGAITASAGTIGGWNINSAHLVDDNNAVKLEPAGLYIISSSDFQVARGGELTASAGEIGSWTIDGTSLKVGTNISLDASGKKITINNATFGQQGIQLEYNSGTPRFYVGDGSNKFIKFDGTDIDLKTAKFNLDTDDLDISSDNGGKIAMGATPPSAHDSGTGIFLSGSGQSLFGNASGERVQYDGTNIILSSSAFFLGSGTQFVSGSDGKIEISSSKFHLTPDGNVTMSGKLTATSGQVGGWDISDVKLSGDNVDLSGSYGLKVFKDADDFVELKYVATDNYGVKGVESGNTIFELGSTNQVAGWTFDNEKLTGGNMIIRKDGTIESDGFVSNLAGSGFRLTAASGGFLEVENARIRGTLSTAVFEKESVNAVGGQLYVANSTILTGSALHPGGRHSAATTTMSVANVSGFAVGEILTLKKITSTGFTTEYISVQSASRFDKSSETNFGGHLFVTRSIGTAGGGQSSGSLGDTPGAAQSYSGSQVLVSTGKIGTGYIRLNANPNDPYTPYMQIVERTGSSIYAVDLKAQVGDLSGITDNSFSDGVTGHGLYTTNGYFKGKIEVASLPKPPATEDLILYYPLQGSFLGSTGIARTADQSGNGHDSRDHATSLPDTTFISGSNSGPTGGALAFDGNSTVVENRTIQNSLTNNMDLTVAYWAKKEGNIAQRCHWHFSDGGNNEIAFFLESSSAPNANVSQMTRVITNNASEGELIIDSGSLQLKDVWRHYAIVMPHGSNPSLYIDGVKRGTYSGTVDFSGVTGIEALNIGCDIDSNLDTRNDYFSGSMADFRVYKKALTTSEIESLYSLPTAGVGRTVIEGNRITTGKIRSSNWGASAGSELDLDAGTVKLGGSTNPLFEVDASGHVSASAGNIAGWKIESDRIVSPNDRLELDATSTNQIKIAKTAVGSDSEDFVRMYYTDNSNYGIQGRHGDANVFQLGATNEIAGWTISSTTLANSTNIILDASNKAISINDATYGNTGIQLQYNSGTPRAFIGKNGGSFVKFDGSNIQISSSDFYLGSKDQFISGSDNKIEISSSKFHLKRTGDAVFAGSLKIGGSQTGQGAGAQSQTIIDFPSIQPLIHFNFNHPDDGKITDGSSNNFTVVFNQAATASGHFDHDGTEISNNTLNHYGMISGSVPMPFGSGSDSITGRSFKIQEGKGTKLAVDDRYGFFKDAGGSPAPKEHAISVWFNCTNVGFQRPQFIWEQGGGSHGHIMYVSSSGTESYLYYGGYEGSADSSAERSGIVSASIHSNQWYHAVGIMKTGTSSLYLNGNHQVTKIADPSLKSIQNYSGIWCLGGIGDNTRAVTHNGSVSIDTNPTNGNVTHGYGIFTGSIDEFRLYTSSITPGNVQALFDYPQGEAPIDIANLPFAGTFIQGDRIKAGVIESNNFGLDAGSQFDLNNGTIILGGSNNPGFTVDNLGFVKATNFSENVVTLTSGNSSLYYSAGNKTLYLDGTLGGDIATNIALAHDPGDIDDIAMPSGSFGEGTTATKVRLIIKTTGIRINEESVLTGGNNNDQIEIKVISDIRLKWNIEFYGTSADGIPVYVFSYIGSAIRYVGTMAQDLLKIGRADAVSIMENGYYAVDYNKLDIDMIQIKGEK